MPRGIYNHVSSKKFCEANRLRMLGKKRSEETKIRIGRSIRKLHDAKLNLLSKDDKEKIVKRNKLKRIAYVMVNKARRHETVKTASQCSNCSSKKYRIEGHHMDYKKPLELVWLCVHCHKKFHPSKKLKSKGQGE